MAGRVFNALGGTVEDPCPTAIGRWFKTGYCNANDYTAWYQAAADMYEQGILLMYNALPESEQADFVDDAQTYKAGFDKLPTKGSILPSTNWTQVVRVMSLMALGDVLITQMEDEVKAAGKTPPKLPRQDPAEPPDPKPAWQKWVIAGVAAVFGIAVGGIVVYAATREE